MDTKSLLHVVDNKQTTGNNNVNRSKAVDDNVSTSIMSVATTDREEEVDKSMYFFESSLPPTPNILIKDDNDDIFDDDDDDEDDNREWMFPNLISSGSYAEFDKVHSAEYVDNGYFKNNTTNVNGHCRQQNQPQQQEQTTPDCPSKQAIAEFVSERLEI